jgi:hypothetical protein
MSKARWLAWKEYCDCDPKDGVNQQHLFEAYGSRGKRQTLCTFVYNEHAFHTYANVRDLCTDRPHLPKCQKCADALLTRTIFQGDVTVKEEQK